MTGDPRPDVVVVGSVNTDVRIPVDEVPRPGETVLASEPETMAGGKGANQAVALARLGRRVSFVGAVGDDADGDRLREHLRTEGVDVSHLATAPGPTGKAHVFITPSGENSIVVSPGANATVTTDAVRRAADLLEAAAVTLAQCEIPLDAVAEAARLARGRFILNPAPALPLPDDLWPHVDVLVPNAHELARLCGVDALPPEPGTFRELAGRLPCPRVVVTRGAAGALLVESGTATLVAAPVVPVVDTTGAGDCFCAALADGLAAGSDLGAAVVRAVRAGALSVQRHGALDSAPTREELDRP